MGTGLYLQPEHLYRPLPLHIGSTGQFSSVPQVIVGLGAPSVSTSGWPSNNLAIYVPVNLPMPFTVARFMVANGSNTTGSVDAGLYSLDGARLLSTGTTARASASDLQYIGVTNQVFPSGQYYLALVGSSTTGTYSRSTFSSAARARAAGVMEEALGSTVLPTNMTPTVFTGTAIFHFGFTQSDSL